MKKRDALREVDEAILGIIKEQFALDARVQSEEYTSEAAISGDVMKRMGWADGTYHPFKVWGPMKKLARLGYIVVEHNADDLDARPGPLLQQTA